MRDDAWRPPDRVPDEVRPGLPTLIAGHEAALQAPTEREVIAVLLGRLAMHYALPDRPVEHHQIVLEDYVEDLAEYPGAVIAEAVREWRRTERWWPKIAEMRDRCEAILDRRNKELARISFLQWCVDRFDGQVPRLMRRIASGLHDAGDDAPAWMLEQLVQGRWEFGGLVFVLPSVNESGEAR